jgi:hypothetical protein
MFVLGMMAGPRRELHVAQLLQLPADGGLVERDGKFVMEPLDQIDQAPAHDAVDGGDRAALDTIGQSLAPCIVEPRPRPGRLAIQQAIGPQALNRITQSRTI